MTQPPTFDLPTEPARTVMDRLAQIPLLVLDVLASAGVGAPNPGEIAERGRSGKPGSRAPVHPDVIDLTRTDTAHTATLVPLPRLVQCSRLVWESFGPDEEAAVGKPPPDPSWLTETDWLRAAWPTAQATMDASVYGWVADEIKGVHEHLCDLARLTRPRRFVCTRIGCNETAHLQPGGRHLVCEGGHTLDVAAERGNFLRSQSWTLTETASAARLYLGVDVNIETWKKWAQRGKLLPANPKARRKRYNFGHVMRWLDTWSANHNGVVCPPNGGIRVSS